MKHFEELYDIMVDGAPVFIPESVRPHVRKLVSIYATAVAQDALKRAAVNVSKERFLRKPDKDSIINTEINLL